MSETEQPRSLMPHILIIGLIILIVLAVVFWPASEPEPEPVSIPVVTQPEVTEPEPEPEPEEFEAAPAPAPVEIEPTDEIEPMPTMPEPEPEPVDISDAAITTALTEIAQSDAIMGLLVNDAVLQRFVVQVANLANDEMAPNYQLLTPPEQSFRVYRQADKEWIDAASYKRYTPYVDALESLDNERLMELYTRYEDEIQNKFAEIGDPDRPFSDVAIEAIDQLLHTPEVPMPVEVYTDSVMYKYADERLESLSAPQKQLLRTGPDNMRRIKAKLRELKVLFEQHGSE